MNEFNWNVPHWFPEIKQDKLKTLKTYYKELLRYNNAINLIGKGTVLDADKLHFADSIKASQIIVSDININSLDVYDIGSGNGFPGLVIAILNSDLKVILIDKDARKCEFLKNMKSLLNLENIKVENCNVEDLKGREIHYIVSRGFASVSKTAMLLLKSIRFGGTMYLMKGKEWSKEVGEMPAQLCQYWMPKHLKDYTLPNTDIVHTILKVDKVN